MKPLTDDHIEKINSPNLDIQYIFEDIPDDYSFSCRSGYESPTFQDGKTWRDLKTEYIQAIQESETARKVIEKLGIKRIEIGSYAWFWLRCKLKPENRIISLSTMHYARLLKTRLF